MRFHVEHSNTDQVRLFGFVFDFDRGEIILGLWTVGIIFTYKG